MRPGAILSRRTRLSETTPHPAAASAGSTSSARVSASFIGRAPSLPRFAEKGGAARAARRSQLPREGLEEEGLFQFVEGGEFLLVEGDEAVGLQTNIVELFG